MYVANQYASWALVLGGFVCGILTTIVCIHSSAIMSNMPFSATTSADRTSIQFTTDELRYVMFGDGDAKLSRRDPRYMDHVRSLIARPSPFRPRTTTHGLHMEHAAIVDQRLGGRQNGFFVECGASDGDFWSNTLFLEVKRNWTGLLIDANKRFFRQMLAKNRQAFAFGGCLSPLKHPATLSFKAAGYQGGMADYLGQHFDSDITRLKTLETVDTVYCVPLVDLLAALGVKHVDYLSLDVQGAELPILKTIDFRSVTIDLIILEAATDKYKAELKQFFNETGMYRVDAAGGNDMVAERIAHK